MTLHSRLQDAITARLELAKAATPWQGEIEIRYGDFGWYVYGTPGGEFEDTEQGKTDARFYAANDPSFVIRACERDLRVLERHALSDDMSDRILRQCPRCYRCEQLAPCEEIRDLATVWSIPIEEEQ